MCLELAKNPNRPWKAATKNIRYKVVFRRGYGIGKYITPYRDFLCQKGKKHTATMGIGLPIPKELSETDKRQFGFHCLMSLPSARKEQRDWEGDDTAIIKVKVKGFIAAGNFCGTRCETYRQMTILREVK